MASSAKPQFGPLMPPTLFSKRWIARFTNLLVRIQLASDGAETGWAWLPEVTEIGFTQVHNFDSQAITHNFTKSTFPTETIPPRGEIKSYFINPFDCADQVRFRVIGYLDVVKEMKHGYKLYGEIKWQEIPLEQRRFINDLLERVQEAEKNGTWKVEGKFKGAGKGVMDKLDAEEAAGKGGRFGKGVGKCPHGKGL